MTGVQTCALPISYAAALQATSAELGVIIPPSIPMILFGVSAEVSIGELFIAGVVPGLMLASALVFLQARQVVFATPRRSDPSANARAEAAEAECARLRLNRGTVDRILVAWALASQPGLTEEARRAFRGNVGGFVGDHGGDHHAVVPPVEAHPYEVATDRSSA